MKYTVTGRVPIATSKGDVEPGGTINTEDFPEYVSIDALAAAGHIKLVDEQADAKPADEKRAAGGGQKPGDK